MVKFSHRLLCAHGWPCPYCKQPMIIRLKGQRVSNPRFPTRDHVVPKSFMPAQGTLIVCHQCNNDKANRTLPQWAQMLSDKGDPRAPIVKELMRKEWFREFLPAIKAAGVPVVEVERI